MLIVIMIGVIMLSVIIMSVVMVSILAPFTRDVFTLYEENGEGGETD